jgi:hypothetical protein
MSPPTWIGLDVAAVVLAYLLGRLRTLARSFCIAALAGLRWLAWSVITHAKVLAMWAMASLVVVLAMLSSGTAFGGIGGTAGSRNG